MRGTWAAGLLIVSLTALSGCGDSGATVSETRDTGATTTVTAPPDTATNQGVSTTDTSPGAVSDDGVAITYRHQATTFTYVQRGDDTAVLGDSDVAIDLAGEDPIGCWRRDDGWECLTFDATSALASLSSLGTFQNVLDELPPTEQLAEHRTMTGRPARCGEIRPSGALLSAITYFSGTDVNRGNDAIEATALCVDEQSGLPLSMRTPVPGKDGAVEITTTEVRAAGDDDFIPPAIVRPAGDVPVDTSGLDQECCDGS